MAGQKRYIYATVVRVWHNGLELCVNRASSSIRGVEKVSKCMTVVTIIGRRTRVRSFMRVEDFGQSACCCFTYRGATIRMYGLWDD